MSEKSWFFVFGLGIRIAKFTGNRFSSIAIVCCFFLYSQCNVIDRATASILPVYWSLPLVHSMIRSVLEGLSASNERSRKVTKKIRTHMSSTLAMLCSRCDCSLSAQHNIVALAHVKRIMHVRLHVERKFNRQAQRYEKQSMYFS